MLSDAQPTVSSFDSSSPLGIIRNLVFILLLAIGAGSYADDSAFGFVASMGGTELDDAFDIAVDASDNVYITGLFADTVDFDPGPGTANLTSLGDDDIFVVKLNSSGSLLWAKSMGSATGFGDEGQGIAVGASGNVYITGRFQDTADFDPGPGTANLTSAGGSDIFVTKLNSSGDFVWAKAMGGTENDTGFEIALDASDNVHITGPFNGTADFDPGVGTANLTSLGGSEAFTVKLNSSGDFVWAKSYGSTGLDLGFDIAVDASGNVHTCGTFSFTADFDPGAGTANLTSAALLDAFTVKLNSSGDFLWAKSIGGLGAETNRGIALDGSGSVYTTGRFQDTVDFDPGPGVANLTGLQSDDIFVTKLNSAGNFVWAKEMSGLESDEGLAIAVDATGAVYTTGSFAQTVDFDPGAGTANLTAVFSHDVYVQKLDTAGNFLWAKSMGGIGRDTVSGIALNSRGDVHTTGKYANTGDFDPGPGTANVTVVALTDVFVSKLSRIDYLSEAWVDFAFAGEEDGSQANPFDSLAEALVAANDAGTVKIKGDTANSSSSETLIIDQDLTIEAINGAVSIGAPVVRGPEVPQNSGFVSRSDNSRSR